MSVLRQQSLYKLGYLFVCRALNFLLFAGLISAESILCLVHFESIEPEGILESGVVVLFLGLVFFNSLTATPVTDELLILDSVSFWFIYLF